MIPLLAPRRRSLQNALTGRLLTGLYLDGSRLHLRLSDAAVAIDLNTRACRQEPHKIWLVFPGWLRISRVFQDAHQVVLETSGAIYSTRIRICQKQGRWQVVFPSRLA